MNEPDIGPGSGPPAPPPDSREDLAAVTSRRSLGELIPNGFVTEAIVAVSLLLLAFMETRGVSATQPRTEDLVRWGANYGPRTTSGEPWRLFTAMFVHVGLFHLAMSMYALWAVGRLMQRLLGNACFLVLYVAAGLAGSVTSLMWNPFTVGAGASGAVFGVFGGLAAFLVMEPGSIPPRALHTLTRGVVLFVGYNFIFAVVVHHTGVAHVNMATHLGGLAAGFFCGIGLAHPLTPEGVSSRTLRAVVVAAGTAAMVLFAMRAVPRITFDYLAELDRFADVDKRARASFEQALEQERAGKTSDTELASVIETRILPEWRAERERFAGAPSLPPQQARLVDQIVAYMTAREDAFGLVARAGHAGDEALARKAGDKQAEAEALAKQIGK